MTRLLALAQGGATRGQILVELARAAAGQGAYARSHDEVTRPRDDPPSALPALVLTARLLFDPRAAGRLVGRAVEDYALTEVAAEAIRRMPAGEVP